MRFSEDDLRAAVAAGAIDSGSATRLSAFLRERHAGEPEAAAADGAKQQFDLAHVLWYAGALIVIAAMGLFSTVAFAALGGFALFVIAVLYAAAFTLAGHHLWHKRNLRVPGGLLIAIAVSMAPLAVYGIQDGLGLWTHGDPGAYRDFYQWIRGSWLFMELAAIAAACIALYFYPFPFLVSIIAFALWFLSMDLTPVIFGGEFSWEMRRTVSLWFGLGVLAIAWTVDRKPRGGDYAFWLHLFGLMAFWGGLSLMDSSGHLGKAIYALINVGLILLSAFLMRRAYAVFGALGVTIYLGYLAYDVFRDALLFPFALSLIGVAIIALGLLYHRKQEALAAWFTTHLPKAVLKLRPAHTK